MYNSSGVLQSGVQSISVSMNNANPSLIYNFDATTSPGGSTTSTNYLTPQGTSFTLSLSVDLTSKTSITIDVRHN
jgi:hypothetical protein